MVKRIDPHTHSAYSDGTDTPAQLLAIAAEAGLDAIALTDHDTTIGWDEAVSAVPDTGVTLIRGAEMSCSASGITVHLLAYLFRPRPTPASSIISGEPGRTARRAPSAWSRT